MFNEQILKELLSFRFDKIELPRSKNPYLVTSARMGCNICHSDFKIKRTKDYPFFTLHIVFEGCSFFHIANRDYLLKKGDAFLITANEDHSYHNTQNTDLKISNTYLTTEFHKYVGTSPYQYIKLKRLEYACYLLDNTDLSCQEIAEKSGFYDSAHFNRIFTQNLHIPPTKYHKRNM